jgi:hypothetical protein
MKIQIQVALEHGVMFLYDPYGAVDIPPDTGASPITLTKNCVCFQVRPFVDGEAHVTLSNSIAPLEIDADLTYTLPTASNHIALTDVPLNYYGLLRVKGEESTVRIWNYEECGVEMTWIQLTDLELF